MNDDKRVLIFGATGHMGGAAARIMLARGWHVRAVTRNPQGEKGKALIALGAEVVQGDMEDRASLSRVFEGMSRVFSVQNWQESGVDGEIRQGKLVADGARAAGVTHLVYGSAGVRDAHTGVPHFDCKRVVETYMRELGLPFTILRPTPFMELLREKAFFPALGAWGTMPRVVGWDLPIPWVCVDDIGQAVANSFADPDRWIGQDIELMGDVQTLRSAQEIFKRVTGRRPLRVPLPSGLFARLAGEEMLIMWQWMVDWLAPKGSAALDAGLAQSRELCPTMTTMAGWLRRVSGKTQ